MHSNRLRISLIPLLINALVLPTTTFAIPYQGPVEPADQDAGNWVEQQAVSYGNEQINSGLDRLEQKASAYGALKIDTQLDSELQLRSGEADLLLPLHETENDLVFIQAGWLRDDEALTGNTDYLDVGVGYRHFQNDWMFGINSFIDHDLQRENTRASIGLETGSDNLRLSYNYYLPLSDWRHSGLSMDDREYDERPAKGFDTTVKYIIPGLNKHLSLNGHYAQFYGDNVIVSDQGTAFDDEHNRYSVDLAYRPIPLLSIAVGQMREGDLDKEAYINVEFSWALGKDLSDQLDSDAVASAESLQGSKYDFVEREKRIVLEYKAQQNGTAPEARDVHLDGTTVVGQTLTASYRYYDQEGDEEGSSRSEWLRDDQTVIGSGRQYSITADDAGHVIRYAITPISVTGSPNTGKPVRVDSAIITGNTQPTASDVSIKISDNKVSQQLQGRYHFNDAENDPEGETQLRWLIDGSQVGQGERYTTHGEDQGKTIVFEVTPIALTGSRQGDVVSAEQLLQQGTAPYAEHVEISGELVVGGTLQGHYQYQDDDNDAEGDSLQRWLVDGKEVAQGPSYTTTVAAEGKVVSFEITPVAATGRPQQGVAVLASSEAIAAAQGTAPVAEQVSISGDTISVGGVITGNYEYSDIDDDLEGVSHFRWLRRGSIIGTEQQYTTTETDRGESLVFEVTPVSATGSPSKGQPAGTETMTIGGSPRPPVVSNVTISGNPEIKNTLSAHYDYSDANLDPEGSNTLIEWLNDNNEVVGTGKDLVLNQQQFAGQYLGVRVTPKNIQYPMTGTAVESERQFIWPQDTAIENLVISYAGDNVINTAPNATLACNGLIRVGLGGEPGFTHQETLTWYRNGMPVPRSEYYNDRYYKVKASDIGTKISCSRQYDWIPLNNEAADTSHGSGKITSSSIPVLAAEI